MGACEHAERRHHPRLVSRRDRLPLRTTGPKQVALTVQLDSGEAFKLKPDNVRAEGAGGGGRTGKGKKGKGKKGRGGRK